MSATPAILIRNATESDFERVVQLNAAEVHYTSQMDLARLRVLDRLSAYHKVAIVDDRIAAFLFAMRAGASYVNTNFDWFSARFMNFLYVDRIVVDAAFAGCGVGSAMYRDLFDFARAAGIDQIACEFNIEPPNPVSQAFHAKWGFEEIGTQWLDGGAKRVSLQLAKV